MTSTQRRAAQAVVLRAAGSFVSLVAEAYEFDRRRALDVEPLRDITRRYRELCDRVTPTEPQALLSLGREIYRWLDGDQGWLAELRPKLGAPFIFEVQTELRPDDAASALLQTPWELLADDGGFLAADDLLRFAPARRLGKPTEFSPDQFRLGVAFMASAPHGANELDYEAEEAAIIKAARHDIDLLIEDSGDPNQLGRRLAALENGPPQVLHLSCHGHNSWKRRPDSAPQPVLMMEDEAGEMRVTSAADLVDALGEVKPHLLFLSACLTAAADEARTSGQVADSFAQVLVGRAGLSAVIGWDGSVADVAATVFAREFYERLAKQWSIAEAAAAARRHLLEAPVGAEPKAPESAVLHRDWHLARVWLGSAPLGGGAIVGGATKRSLLPPNHGHKRVLAQKSSARLEVADPTMFVGRRRELQRALRALSDGEHAGVLLHGMGRLGKSSLAARIADRRPDLRFAVVFGAYDALSVLDDLEEALVDHAPARELLAVRRASVRDNPDALYPLLVDLLAGPCAQQNGGKPVLLLVDDLERVLEPSSGDAVRRVGGQERAVMRSILRAFDPMRSESRLLITSRFPFTLLHGDLELTQSLYAIQLPEFPESTRRKLLRRQIDAARSRPGAGSALSEDALTERLPYLLSAEKLACGNPGLQDLIGDKLVLRSAVPIARLETVLEQMAAFRSGGDLPADEMVRAFLENLAIDEILEEAGPAGNALLRAATLFELPVPVHVFDIVAAQVGGSPRRLSELGLLDPAHDFIDRGEALAINTLVAGRISPLDDADAIAIAKMVVHPLLSAWGGAGGIGRLHPSTVFLTRLGLLADDAGIVEAAAPVAIQVLLRSGRNQEAAGFARRALALLLRDEREPSLLLLAGAAGAFEIVGDGEAVKQVLAIGVSLVRSLGAGAEHPEIGVFLFRLGAWQITSGELDAAKETFEQLYEIERAHANEHQMAVAKGRIADILQARGELDEALRIRREETLPVYLRLGDMGSVALTRGRIADILQARGDLDEALRIRREETLPAYVRLNDVRSIALTHGRIADILQARGELDEALRIRREEELPVYTRLADVHSIAVTQGQVADILAMRGDVDEALRIRRDETLPVYTRLGDVRAIAVTQGQIADILQSRGDLNEALRIRREETLPVYTRLRDIYSVALTQGRIADILHARGELDEALRIRRDEALPVFLRLGDVRSVALTQGRIADILQARGDLDEAMRIRREEELPVYTRLGDVLSIAVTKSQIADILATRGELDEALRIFRDEALPAYLRLGDVRSVAMAQGRIAEVFRARGDLDEALRIWREQTLPVYTRLGDVRSIAITQGHIADVFEARGELDEALRIRRDEELPVYTQLGDVQAIATTQSQIADILRARGELDEALRLLREEALPAYVRLGDVRSVAMTQGRIADVFHARGDLDEALTIRREEELPVYTRLGDVRSIAVTQGQIADILVTRGELDEALRIRREETLPAYVRLGDERSVALTQGRIAHILMLRGELDEAIRIRREEQLPIYERLGDARSVAITQEHISSMLVQADDLDGAADFSTRRLAALRTLGDEEEIASALFELVQIDLARGKIANIGASLAESWSIVDRIGRVEGIAVVGNALGQVLAASGSRGDAIDVLLKSMAAYTALGREDDASRVRQTIDELRSEEDG